MKRILLGCLSLMLVAGCAINQKVQPVSALSTKNACILDNDKVRPAFREAIVKAMSAKGFTMRVVPDSTAATECPVRVLYTANWTWDLAMYMRRAEIIVYEGDRISGRATYDASAAGARPDKFIEAETKVNELIDQLFPN
jgi:hypothetical protein